MQWLGQCRPASKLSIAALCCILVLATPWLLLSEQGQTYFHQHTNTSQLNVTTLDSWPYVEVVTPDDSNVWPYRVFRSSSLTPPNLTITYRQGDLSDGYLFITPGNRSWDLPGEHQGGPFIIGTDNELVYRFEESLACHDFRVQEINDKPHLTFWHGERGVGHGYGNIVMVDSEYQETRLTTDAPIKWMAKGDRKPPGFSDFHENQMTSRGTILVTAYNDTSADLSPIGGPSDGVVVDSLVLEINITTGETVFSWSALEHVPLKASKLPILPAKGDGTVGRPWDHFHINSIQDLPEGILVSGRHTWAVYLISRDTGDVIWTLNGSGEGGGDFGTLPEEGKFRWQHHARIYDKTESKVYLSLFDNHYMKEVNTTRPSRGLLLELPAPPNRSQSPRVVGILETTDGVFSDSQGSVDTPLSNGNALVGYGPIPIIREFGSLEDGADLRWEARFGNDNRAMTYRAFKSVWHGTPRLGGPSLVLEAMQRTAAPGFSAARAYVSWNGATDVDRWNVYAKEPAGRRLVGTAVKRGFETVFDVDVSSHSPCVEVTALQDGSEIRYSNVACL